ncbi:hypothetical protein OIU84_002566 [Salix udensis]|uniref:Uncharacterized protein n=1 Tax=Salix udensis TaxID=889485 RepID=A0AAD6K6B5_9ROSI|nr:hypothetical protein OIU84_002566 [Salix udensis]
MTPPLIVLSTKSFWLIQPSPDTCHVFIETHVLDHPLAEGSCRSSLGSPNHALARVALTQPKSIELGEFKGMGGSPYDGFKRAKYRARIVHSNGRVEEISGSIRASEIMKAYPKHILKKPSSPSDDGFVPKIVIVPPDAELQRGKIYFLMPAPPTQETKSSRSSRGSGTRKKRREISSNSSRGTETSNSSHVATNSISMTSNPLISDQYLSEILSEKLSAQRDRRRGRVGVWRPHLESITEAAPHDA